MCDFDRKGFTAVDAFFGTSDEPTAASKPVRKLSATTHPKAEPLWKQKQTRKRSSNYDDDNAIDGVDGSRQDDGDDDEEGRTAISNAESSQSKPSLLPAVLEPNKKKKLGKKERAKRSMESKEKNVSQKEQTESSGHDQQATMTETKVKGNKRQKRKKVRSRQKNIRKDHRDVVPSHVKLRPLTAETRQLKYGVRVVVDGTSSPFSAKES